MSKELFIQSRQIRFSDISEIKKLMSENPAWNRTKLSKELCLKWDWRTDRGQLKDMACRTMLRKLEERELIKLPKALHAGRGKKRIREVLHATEPMECELTRLMPIQMEVINGVGYESDLFHCLLSKYHYLGCQGHVGEHMKYIAYSRAGSPLACILFGAAAWQVADRDQFIGWDAKNREKNLQLITNNTRFLILPWVKVPHLASHLLGKCVRRLRKDWLKKYGHNLYLVETFVDSSRFLGTCYKAANWEKIGKTKGRGRQNKRKEPSVPIKDIYIYPLLKEYKRNLIK